MKTQKVIFVLFAVLLAGSFSDAFSQLNITTDNTVTPLVQRAFNIESIKISNVSFKGAPVQFGYFTNGKTAFNIDSGLVLSSGEAKGIETGKLSTQINSGISDPDLLLVGKQVLQEAAPGAEAKLLKTQDAAVIELDFISSSSEVKFQFVFASTEYPNFLSEPFADIMGIFIAGKGYSGIYSAPAGFPNGSEVVSLLPNSTTPVSEASVNPNINFDYYFNNTSGQNPANPFPGYTKVFTISLAVFPCETYHLKLAVSDGDGIGGATKDGALFFSASASQKEKYQFTAVEANTKQPSTQLIENCESLEVTINRLHELPNSDTVFVSIDPSSTAKLNDINGVTGMYVFPPGLSTTQFQLFALQDGLNEGNEKLILNFDYRYGCISYREQRQFNLRDIPPLMVTSNSPSNQTLDCPGQQLTLQVNVTGGYGNYIGSWRKGGAITGQIGFSYTDNPAASAIYTYIVQDACNAPITETFNVDVKTNSPIVIDLPDTTGSACFGSQLQVAPNSVSGGSSVYNYRWIANGTDTSYNPTVRFVPEANGYIYFNVTDNCGVSGSDSTYLKVGVQRAIRLEVSADTIVCKGQPVVLNATATGGTGNLKYNWPQLNNSRDTVMFVPQKSSRITVEVTDDCGVLKSEDIAVDINEVTAEYEYRYENDILVFDNYSVGSSLSYQWFLNDSLISEDFTITLPVIDYNTNVVVKIVTTDDLGCSDSVQNRIAPPLIVFIPNAFTPDADGYNDIFQVVAEDLEEFSMVIYDRWGRIIFESDDPSKGWDGHMPNQGNIVQGMYVVYVKAVRNSKSRYEGYATVAVMY